MPKQTWPGYTHNDWLEARVDFEWIGFFMIVAMLAIIFGHWFKGEGLALPWELVACTFIAMGGCMLHANFGFPFQIHSILLLFVILCAIIFASARPGGAGAAAG